MDILKGILPPLVLLLLFLILLTTSNTTSSPVLGSSIENPSLFKSVDIIVNLLSAKKLIELTLIL